jgi:hypothetical protein
VRSLVHWGIPANGRLDFAVELGAASTVLDLGVVEHSLRPKEVLGSYFFQRPDSMLANTAMATDRVIQRTRLRVYLDDNRPVTNVTQPGSEW